MLYGNLTRSCLWLYRNLFFWLNAKRVKEEQGALIPWERNPKWIDGWYSLIWVNYVEDNRVRCYSSCILEPGVFIIVSEVLRAKIDQRIKKINKLKKKGKCIRNSAYQFWSEFFKNSDPHTFQRWLLLSHKSCYETRTTRSSPARNGHPMRFLC